MPLLPSLSFSDAGLLITDSAPRRPRSVCHTGASAAGSQGKKLGLVYAKTDVANPLSTESLLGREKKRKPKKWSCHQRTGVHKHASAHLPNCRAPQRFVSTCSQQDCKGKHQDSGVALWRGLVHWSTLEHTPGSLRHRLDTSTTPLMFAVSSRHTTPARPVSRYPQFGWRRWRGDAQKLHHASDNVSCRFLFLSCFPLFLLTPIPLSCLQIRCSVQ